MPPKVVDADGRREEIISVYLNLVARVGLANANSRALAAELGVANGALWHYFKNKDDLITQATDRIVANTDQRILSKLEGLSGIAAIEVMLEELLPLKKLTQDEARTIVNFWGLRATAGDADRKGAPEVARWTADVDHHLREAVRDGGLREDTPTRLVAELLISLVTAAQVNFVVGDLNLDGLISRAQALLDLFRS